MLKFRNFANAKYQILKTTSNSNYIGNNAVT